MCAAVKAARVGQPRAHRGGRCRWPRARPCRAVGALADEVVCVYTPRAFRAVGLWYEDFGQTGDEEVCALLRRPS